MKNLVWSAIVASVLTSVSYVFGFYFGYITTINWLEVFSVWTSYSSTYLFVKQTRLAYIIGAVSIVALCALFYQQSLVGSMSLQGYLFLDMLFGWFWWRSDAVTRPVTNMTWDWVSKTCLISAPFLFILIILTSKYLDGNYILLDSIIFVASMIAQFLLDLKKLENWFVWIIVNIISVIEYWEQGLIVLAIQMGLFIGSALWGLYEWNNSKNKNFFGKYDEVKL